MRAISSSLMRLARWWLGELQPAKGCLGNSGHDLAEVLAVERAVREGAVLEEANAQHLEGAAGPRIARHHPRVDRRAHPDVSPTP